MLKTYKQCKRENSEQFKSFLMEFVHISWNDKDNDVRSQVGIKITQKL